MMIDFMSPISGPRILNKCVLPLENRKATLLFFLTDPAFFVSLVFGILPLSPFTVRKTLEKNM